MLKIRIYTNDKLYYFAYAIWFISDIINTTTISDALDISYTSIDNIINFVVLFFLVLRIIRYQNYSLREILTISILSVPIIVSAIMSKNYNFVSFYIFVAAAKNIDKRRIVRNTYHILLTSFFIVGTLCGFGILKDIVIYRGSIVRHSCGFTHPNVFGIRLFLLVICYLLLNENKLIRQMVVICIAGCLEFFVANSQSAFYLLAALFVIVPIMYLCRSNESIKSFALKGYNALTIMICSICVYVTVFDYSKIQLLKKLDVILTYRFLYSHRAYNEFGIKLLGQIIYIYEEERRKVGLLGRLYLDNSYAILLIRYGILIFLIFVVWYVATMEHYRKEGAYYIVTMLFIYAIYGIMEPSMFLLRYNVMLLFMADVLYRSTIGNSYEEIPEYKKSIEIYNSRKKIKW